jgi:hypothetical protein
MRREGKQVLTQTERTRRSRLKRHAKGLCWFCTNRIAPGSSGMCADHLAKNRSRTRVTQGSTIWRPGRAGRPPLWSKQEHAA